MQYTSFIKKILSQDEYMYFIKKHDLKTMTDKALLNTLLGEGYLFSLDWKGEAQAFDFERFIMKRLNSLTDQTISFANPYELYKQKNENPRAGDFAVFLIDFYNTGLSTTDYQLLEFQTNSDYYLFLLVNKKNATALKKIKDSFWCFYDQNSKPTAVLYEVICPICNNPNFGEVPLVDGKESINLANQGCDNCKYVENHTLFDENGLPQFQYEKVYFKK